MATEDIFFEFIADDSPSIEDDFLEKAVKEQLLTYCQNLKSPYDEVAEKYFYEELSFAEVAKVLKRNEKTIQTQVYRAKAMLRKQYEVLKQEGVAVNE